jgi:hypothetical protein
MAATTWPLTHASHRTASPAAQALKKERDLRAAEDRERAEFEEMREQRRAQVCVCACACMRVGRGFWGLAWQLEWVGPCRRCREAIGGNAC